MRRLAAVMTVFLAVLIFGMTASADGADLLSDYGRLEWSGAPLEYNSGHKTLKFRSDPSSSPNGVTSAYIDFPANGADGFLFHADMGNYSGGGAGQVSVYFYNAENNCVGVFRSDMNVPDGCFRRYQLGSEEGYVKVPENAVTARVWLCWDADSGESPYFRNLSLLPGSTVPLSDGEPEWTVSGKLELVQVKATKADYWIWVGIIVIVPLIFFGARKMRERAAKIK